MPPIVKMQPLKAEVLTDEGVAKVTITNLDSTDSKVRVDVSITPTGQKKSRKIDASGLEILPGTAAEAAAGIVATHAASEIGAERQEAERIEREEQTDRERHEFMAQQQAEWDREAEEAAKSRDE